MIYRESYTPRITQPLALSATPQHLPSEPLAPYRGVSYVPPRAGTRALFVTLVGIPTLIAGANVSPELATGLSYALCGGTFLAIVNLSFYTVISAFDRS